MYSRPIWKFPQLVHFLVESVFRRKYSHRAGPSCYGTRIRALFTHEQPYNQRLPRTRDKSRERVSVCQPPWVWHQSSVIMDTCRQCCKPETIHSPKECVETHYSTNFCAHCTPLNKRKDGFIPLVYPWFSIRLLKMTDNSERKPSSR